MPSQSSIGAPGRGGRYNRRGRRLPKEVPQPKTNQSCNLCQFLSQKCFVRIPLQQLFLQTMRTKLRLKNCQRVILSGNFHLYIFFPYVSRFLNLKLHLFLLACSSIHGGSASLTSQICTQDKLHVFISLFCLQGDYDPTNTVYISSQGTRIVKIQESQL